MPNWCMNSLTVEGDASEIAKFKQWLDYKPLTLQKILPMPKELEETTSPTPDSEVEKAKELAAKYGASNWYDWHINNWGTKWDIEADEDDYDSTDTCIRYSFDSAWSPPTNAIIALGTQFPNLSLTLSYREDGCGFAGVLKVNGDDVDDNYYDADKDKDSYRQFVYEEYGDDPYEDQDDDEEVEESDSTN